MGVTVTFTNKETHTRDDRLGGRGAKRQRCKGVLNLSAPWLFCLCGKSEQKMR
jgi:hypothetical protein